MRHPAFVLCLLPSLVLALGMEDTSFHGRLPTGQAIRLTFVDDPQPWSKGNPIYGSPTSASLAFCWPSREEEMPVALHCARTRGAAATLTYRVVDPRGPQPQYGDPTPEAAEYRAIARSAGLGTGAERGDATLLVIYECQEGCTPEVPRRLFEVGVYD